MEERGPIQLAPPGLLGLLGLKADGRAVPKLGDVCVPSLEMSTWWLRAAATLLTTANGATVPAGTYRGFLGYTPGIAITNGQWWYVHDYSVSFTAAAANTATNISLAATSVASGNFYSRLGTDKIDNLAAGTSVLLGAQGFWLPPGSTLGYWVDTVVGAAGLVSAVTQLRYTPCGF